MSLMLLGVFVELVAESSLNPGQELRGNIGTSRVSTIERGGDSERRNSSAKEVVRSGSGFVSI